MSTSPFRKNEASAEALPQEKAHYFHWEYILVPFALLVFGYMLLQSLWIYVNSQTLLPSSAVNIPLQSEIKKAENQQPVKNTVQPLVSELENNEKPLSNISSAVNKSLHQEISKNVEKAAADNALKERSALGSRQIEKTALLKTPETVQASQPLNAKKATPKDKKKQTKALKPKPQKAVKKTIKKTLPPKKKETVKKKQPVRSSKQTQENDFQVLEQSLGL